MITYIDQPLPPKSELAKFWAHSENKINLQQFFIKWLEEHIDIEIPVYLGGCNENNLYSCYRLIGNNNDEIRRLYCEHEEADNGLQFHISHAVQVGKFENVLVCSGDTDVCTSLLYNYEFNWKKYGLHQIW